jgi:hypothetical protein
LDTRHAHGRKATPFDSDVVKLDRLAQNLDPKGLDRWAEVHKFFEGLDRLRQNLDEIARTDFRQIAGGSAEGTKGGPVTRRARELS